MSSIQHSAEPATTVRLRPDDVPEFRLAQLLLLLTEAAELGVNLDLHRLAVSDFVAANPLLVLEPTDVSYRRLRLAGFTDHPLTNAAPGQRYATRRERLVADLTRLVSYGLVRMFVVDARRVFRATDRGRNFAAQLTSVYADAYRASAQVMLPHVRRLSDAALQRELSGWLRADPVLFDLLGTDGDETLFEVDQ